MSAMASSLRANESGSPKEHIERMRRERYYIGRDEESELSECMHNAVNYLSEELYSKDVHFLMELIQNAEDNEYPPDVVPSLEFVITSKDITATGAMSTLLVFNNEKGFSPMNIESLCKVGSSTKKGKRHCGYIGEKGIGFKSVFLVTSQPYIFSGGYQIRFNEKPTPECSIGYIVPEWVQSPSLHDITQIYGSSGSLPTTTIILPLKYEKVEAVKKQLSNLHPEILLFLSKIRQLSVRESNSDPRLNTVKAVSISSETNFQRRKGINAESYTIHLASQESNINEEECSYYMWKQKFPVKPENRVEKRMEVEEWAITLAFPYGQRLDRGLRSPGIYAFLPTEMQTNFPFIVQADFILASSRESILLDNKWNKGILDCVTPAFVNALVSLVKSTEAVPLSSLPPMFHFLPIKPSTAPVLDQVRLSIKEKLVGENIIPCESYTKQKIFCKASEVGRLMPGFWNILIDAEKQGVSLQTLSSHGTFILSSAFDEEEYDVVLDFLGVGYVSNEWYVMCIESSNLTSEVSEKLYLDLLCFLADNWQDYFNSTNIRTIPLLKYVDINGKVSLWSINRASQFSDSICLSSEQIHISWMIDWNREFECTANLYFIPESTQRALQTHSSRSNITSWLQYVNVETLNLYDYGLRVLNAVKGSRKHLIAFTHFLYHSLSENYMTEQDITKLCKSMPIVDNYGHVTSEKTAVLVPANCSNWVGLMGSNPWRSERYVELGADYVCAGHFAGTHTPESKLLKFLSSHIEASDVPYIRPPNAAFPTVSSSLTKENTFLLLEWIRNLKCRGTCIPEKFLQCIRTGRWLRTSVGNKSPEESFLSNSQWGNLLQMGSVLVDIPLIDQEFYDNQIGSYKEELKTLGVMYEFGEACQFIGKSLMLMDANSTLTRSKVFSMLDFIRFLREKYLSPENFIKSIKLGRWLKTSHGFKSPTESILFSSEWNSALSISNLPFIDTDYYGKDILGYSSELKLLEVIVGFNDNYQLVVSNLQFSKSLSSMTADNVVFMLECIRHASSTEKLISKLKNQTWLKTNLGVKCPAESIMFDPDWECLLQVVDNIPVIDELFYGSRIRSYQEEMKKIGVVVQHEGVSKVVAHEFKQLISSSSFTKKNVFGLLACYKHLIKKEKKLPMDLLQCIHREKWLRTRMGYRSPEESILFDSVWDSITPIAFLPFIDDSEAGYGKQIYEYRDELKRLGVVVNIQKGSKFVAAGLIFPPDLSKVSPSNVLSLLQCIRYLKKQNPSYRNKDFLERISKKWLKTTMGFKSPNECILFDSKWCSFLEREDAPFIDEAFYGQEIVDYKDELEEIGVAMNVSSGCSLVADHLKYHSHFVVVTRIYAYLKEYKWKPEEKEANWIWIPDGGDSGEWVSPKCCVLHDRNSLFCSKLHVLEKYYEKKLLGFFPEALDVKNSPRIDDYCELWKEWENTREQLTEAECCAFWVHVAKQGKEKTTELLSARLEKLPVSSQLGISLSNKQNVFIPDNLLLKDLMDKASQDPLFVWHPQPSLAFLPRSELYDIYSSLGVQAISKVVKMEKSSISSITCLKKVDKKDKPLKIGLFRIILGFLADPSLDMSVEKRHQIVKFLSDAKILETEDPIKVSYSLPLSSGKFVNVSASRIFHWDRENSKFFLQKMDTVSCRKAKIEFATYFAEVISEGLLWDKPYQIASLSELIKIGCLLGFDAAAVDFLLKSKNLQLFLEDEEFLSSTFPSG